MPEHDDIAPLDAAEWAELRSLVERASIDDLEWEPAPSELWRRVVNEIDADHVPVRSIHDQTTSRSVTSRRRWIAGAGLAATAAAVLAVVVMVIDKPDVDVVAAVELEPLTGSGSGRAELVSVGDGVQLRLQTDGLGTPDGYFEVWLIDPSVTELVSLGPLRADGRYDLPPGVQPAAFPIVDVSVEPVDGDPAHSGDSVLRGELPTPP